MRNNYDNHLWNGSDRPLGVDLYPVPGDERKWLVRIAVIAVVIGPALAGIIIYSIRIIL